MFTIQYKNGRYVKHIVEGNTKMELERSDVPHALLEHFLMTTQGYDEADAFLYVLQNYEKVREEYYQHIKLN